MCIRDSLMGSCNPVLDISRLQKSVDETFPVSCKIDLSGIDKSFGVVEVDGEIKNSYGSLLVNMTFRGMYKTACDRCLEAVALPLRAEISTSLTAEGSKDDSIAVEKGRIDLQKKAYDALCLEIPMRILCREDCKGLCYICGQNLNIKQCDCVKDNI